MKLFVVAVLLAVAARSASGVMRCNGMAGLCKLKFNQVTFAGTHNAGANGVMKYDPWPHLPAMSCWYRNQDKGYKEQLEYGIRFFDIDTWCRGGTVYNSHSDAYKTKIKTSMDAIAEFLNKDSNRNVVIAMRFQDSRNNYKFSRLGPILTKYFSGTGGKVGMNRVTNGDYTNWPTMEQAINANARVFVFIKDNLCDAACRAENTFARPMTVTDTWLNLAVSSSCGSLPDKTKTKCQNANQPLVLVSAFASSGLCVSDMQKLCNKHIPATAEKCQQVLKSKGKTVNFLTADYVNQASSTQNVVKVALDCNYENIKNFG